jgi:hypothetical protein
MKSLIVRANSVLVGHRPRMCGSAALAIALVVPVIAFASARVSGTAQSVTVDAQNSSIKEILYVLTKQLNLRVRSSVDLDRQAAGTYQGSLPRVVTRLLEGYNFIIKTSERGIEVTVLGTQNNPSTARTPATRAGTYVAAHPSTPVESSRVGNLPSNRAASIAQAHQPVATAPSRSSPDLAPARSALSNRDKPSDSAIPAPLPDVAEASMRIPMPNSSNESGPVPRPGTALLPTSKISSAMSNLMPIPTNPANAPVLPMPTSSMAFPGIPTQTGNAVLGSFPADSGQSTTSTLTPSTTSTAAPSPKS